MQITEYKHIQLILNNNSSLNELQHSNVSSILSNPTEPQRSMGSAMHFPIHPKQHAFQNTLKNSGATSTAINVTGGGGVQNLVKGNI